ncbi:aminopeptidase P family protein [Campylobacter sp. RM9344]|uniref:Aminopeptidase P family protein n=1 Tax=Campylobacter californiensis TaxID=1032243 RepID=A0AAW3ZVA0_9BACT|nr:MULTISPECIES: M24 family metallopeptidase [unclassified Campylobacter]MBE2984377.1 aminopeptidase P family protein [Campylobacter sp. RM6883]MBE2995812.1 aminopeptidase P family protein [Campylobacter sp. RM6913]MBE3029643.1 aminopeptidase P family protein [Campylobacter sp. RM9344]MBE3607128.1 aminopeptidase P family protein [Campylobacter sp. RM9337]QCD50273.1 X-Pro dipeptidase [Campylobacter sp. RM6914]
MNYILKDENAVFFECGYSCDNEILLCIDGVKYFLSDARYYFEAKKLVNHGVIVVLAQRNLIQEARMLLRKLKPKSLVYNPDELSVSTFTVLSKGLGINFKPKANFSQIKRMIKSEEEIEILSRAAKFGAECFDEFAEFVRKNGEGMSERELHFNAQSIFKRKNELGLSFDPIVAINENAAKAHALPGDKILRYGDLLLLDAGVKFNRYCSDRTRTACFDENFNFSKEQKFKNPKHQEIYEIVKEAQKVALDTVKVGIKAGQIDKAARDVIVKAGYEKAFFHSTGHGVGVDIHELPVIGARSEAVIKEGMVFSIEPGIYLENEFGVRIEDVVVATKDGARIL